MKSNDLEWFYQINESYEAYLEEVDETFWHDANPRLPWELDDEDD